MPKHLAAAPRRVDLLKGDDSHFALLGSLGFPTRLIHYRTGDSPLAERVLTQARRVAVTEVQSHIRRVLSAG